MRVKRQKQNTSRQNLSNTIENTDGSATAKNKIVRPRPTMETMELKHSSEIFHSPMTNGGSEMILNDMIMNSSLSCMFDESMAGADNAQYNIFNELYDQTSLGEEDRTVDIESIDELSGIMESPDKMVTFSSFASSAPVVLTSCQQSPRHNSNFSKFKRPQTLKQPAMGRTRHNSELMMLDLVALHDQFRSNTGSTQLPAAGDAQVEETFTVKLEEEDFSLLGIDGIEAEDLETLFQQFEGATKSPLKAKVVSPVKSAATKPQPLTLEDYRRIRGINTSFAKAPKPDLSVSVTNPRIRKIGFDVSRASENAKSAVSKTSKFKPGAPPTEKFNPLPKDPRLQSGPAVPAHIDVTQKVGNEKDGSALHRSSSLPVPLDKLKAMPLPLKEPPSSFYKRENSKKASCIGELVKQSPAITCGSQTAPVTMPAEKSQAEIVGAIALDHGGYCKPRPVQDRNIKAELTMLLKKIPELIAQTSSQSPAASNEKGTTPSCSCDTQVKKPKISSESSAHDSSIKLAGDRKQQALPKAYILPTRGRPRKRKYRKRSPSSCRSSSSSSDSSSDSDSSSCESCCSRNSSRRKSSAYTKRHKKTSSKRSNRKNRVSNHSRSSRGRHKESSHSRRKRHKSIRSSRSVSPYSNTTSSSSRSPSPSSPQSERRRKEAEEAHSRAMAERRVVYVGGIEPSYTKADLRKRFGGFGEIENVKTRLRDGAENYGFVTFYSKAEAYAAFEKGNDVYGPKFNLGFGGRRTFCSTEYADLDGCQAVKEEWAPSVSAKKNAADDFDKLLQQSMRRKMK